MRSNINGQSTYCVLSHDPRQVGRAWHDVCRRIAAWPCHILRDFDLYVSVSDDQLFMQALQADGAQSLDVPARRDALLRDVVIFGGVCH